MTFAEDVGLRPVHSNPARKIKLYRERSRERFLSEAEISKAAEAISTVERDGKIGPHAAAGLRLALFTGARSGEITAAKWEHVDRARRIIRLPDSKTNEPRTIHLSDAAMEVLAAVPRVGPYIVAGAKPNESLKNLGRCWTVARKRAGLTAALYCGGSLGIFPSIAAVYRALACLITRSTHAERQAGHLFQI